MEVFLLARCFWLLIGLSLFRLSATVSQAKVSTEAGSLKRDEGSISGHINGRGIYVSDTKVGVIQENARSEAPSKDGIGKIQQPAFMQRELNHGGDGVLEAEEKDVMDDEWLDLQPVALAEAEASTVSNMDESFNWWDRRRRRRRYDCRWTQWQGWKACTVNCGAGEKQRDRQTDGPHWGGKICEGPKSEYSTCNLQNCAVNCEWNHWGAWGPCSKTCGGGNRVRQRGALPFTNRDGGAICLESQKKKSGICNSFKCPVPCTFGPWSLWGGCSKTCNTGLKRRTRDRVGPLYGGHPCRAEAFIDEKCNAFSCPVDCAWNAWGGWGQCSRTCGGGIRLRERAYLSQAQNGGAACPGSPAEILACNIEECAIDCRWAPWHDPGPCTKTCGGGAFTRHRAKIVESSFGGKVCTGPNTEVGPCNVEPCAQDCIYEDWQPFSECTASCGGGIHTSRRNGTEALHGGVSCSKGNLSIEEECNTAACPHIMVKNGALRHDTVLLSAIAAPLLLLRIGA